MVIDFSLILKSIFDRFWRIFDQKIDQKSIQKASKSILDFCIDFKSIFGSKIHKKSIQKSMKKLIAFGIDFFPILSDVGLDFGGFWIPKGVAQFCREGFWRGLAASWAQDGLQAPPKWLPYPSKVQYWSIFDRYFVDFCSIFDGFLIDFGLIFDWFVDRLLVHVGSMLAPKIQLKSINDNQKLTSTND